MKEYIEERQNILNLFVPYREFPNRPVPSPFMKKSKTTPSKRSCMESRCDIKKLSKGDKRCFQYQGFLQDKAAEIIPQNVRLTQPVVVTISKVQEPIIGTYVQPVTATAPTQTMVTISRQPQ